MASGGKTGAVEKVDGYLDDLVAKKHVGGVPLPGGEVYSRPHVRPRWAR